MDARKKAIEKAKGGKEKDEMARKYGGMTSSGGYIKPDTKGFKERYSPKGFKTGMREINRLKRQGK